MLHTKYTVRNKRPSYAFLMEMLWVCGFFAIAACIFVMAFAKGRLHEPEGPGFKRGRYGRRTGNGTDLPL